MTREPTSPAGLNRGWIAWVALSIAGLLLHAWSYDFVTDDTFITLRYARNFLDGHGFTYNLGERVEGYTSPLWLMLITACGRAGLDLLASSRALSVVSAAGTLVVACVLVRRLGPGLGAWAALPAALVASNAPTACWTMSGMETLGYTLAIPVAILASQGSENPSRRLLAGFALAALALMRPEGLGLALLIAVVSFFSGDPRGRVRRTLSMVVPFALVVGAHFLWRFAYYGDWLPNTYYAKVGWSLAQLERGVLYVFSFVRDAGGLFLWLAPLGGALWRRDSLWWATSLTMAALVAGVIWAGGDGQPMYRFMVPIVPLWAVLWGALLADAFRFLESCGLGRRDVRVRTAAAIVAALAGLSGLLPNTSGVPYLQYVEHRWREVPEWTEVGRWLKAHAAPGDSVALVPVGAVGYYSGLKVYDMMGLTDRHIARRVMPLGGGWAGHEKHDGAYILAQRPTFLLLGNIRVRGEPLAPNDPRFVRPDNPNIRAREDDVFRPELFRDYEPQVARLANGKYLHFLRRRQRAAP